MDIIQDSFENTSDVRIPLAIIHSDFQGAFDGISRLFIYDLMSIAGFHPGMIDSIKCWYSGATAKL